MQNLPMLDKTRNLLLSCDMSLRDISNMTGLGYEWLRKFKADLIPDPSVNKVQVLHDFLNKTPDLIPIR